MKTLALLCVVVGSASLGCSHTGSSLELRVAALERQVDSIDRYLDEGDLALQGVHQDIDSMDRELGAIDSGE